MPPIKISSKAITGGRRTTPLWNGPCVDGVTQSMLGRYLACPERFRIKTIEGWEVKDHFRHALEYGNMWHICEEHFAKVKGPISTWQAGDVLLEYVRGLVSKYPFQRAEVAKWYEVCKVQFPLYADFWKRNPDVIKRQPLFQEKEFKVPYKLPSGRVALLRGKWDSVDLINGGIWLQENKTKSEIDQDQLTKQLSFDMQTMVYLVALSTPAKITDSAAGRDVPGWPYGAEIKGVRYNVIRRPLSGGKGTIKQSEGTKGTKCPKCKGVPLVTQRLSGQTGLCIKCNGKGRIGAKPPESDEEFYNRLGQYIKDDPKSYFARWQVSVSQKDLDVFQQQTLIPILENLCDDYEWWSNRYLSKNKLWSVWDNGARKDCFPNHCHRHYRYPYGVYNPLNDGGYTELDEYLANGSIATLQQCSNLFPELKGE